MSPVLILLLLAKSYSKLLGHLIASGFHAISSSAFSHGYAKDAPCSHHQTHEISVDRSPASVEPERTLGPN